MSDNKILRHFVFWPNLVAEIYSQFITIPGLWFVLSQPDFFKFNWLNLISAEITKNLIAAILLWLLSCVKLISISGYFFNNRRMMQLYCISQLLYLGIGMTMQSVVPLNNSLNIDSMWWLAQSFLAIYLALRKNNISDNKKLA